MSKKRIDSKINPTLQSVTKLAEKQRELVSKLTLGNTVTDLNAISEQLRTTLLNPSLEQAFKTQDSYLSTLKNLEESLASKNISSIQKFGMTIPSSLKKDYQLAFKATDQWKKTAEQLQSLGFITDQKKEWEGLSKLALAKSPVEYASEVAKATTGLSQSSFFSQLQENQKKIKEYYEPSVKFTSSVKTDIREIDKINNEIMEVQQKQLKKREKREQAVYENSETQVELLQSIMNYMSMQSENLSLQNDILSEQVEKIKIQNNQAEEQITEIKKQNKFMQEQQEENRKSSKTALWTAIISIFLGVLVGIGSIYFSYLIYEWEDKSDNQNHNELLHSIEKSTKNNELSPLLQTQIKNSQTTNKLLKKLIEEQKKQQKKQLLNN
jgi:hypothetical protein